MEFKPQRRWPDSHVVDDKRAVARAQHQIFDLYVDFCRTFGKQFQPHWIAQRLMCNGSHFTRHSMMTPEVWTVRQRFIVHFNNVVRREQLIRFKLHNAGMIAINAELKSAGEHSVALYALNHRYSCRKIYR
jgi:hypothetical protein